jgi:hypothetical protein
MKHAAGAADPGKSPANHAAGRVRWCSRAVMGVNGFVHRAAATARISAMPVGAAGRLSWTTSCGCFWKQVANARDP